VHRVSVFVREDGDCARPDLDSRAKRPNCDFTAVRYKNLFEQCVALRHGQYIGGWGLRESLYFT
jgi:hypothetical protein